MSHNPPDASVIPADDNMTDAPAVTTLNIGKYLPASHPNHKLSATWSVGTDTTSSTASEPYGLMATPSLRGGWISQSSLASCLTHDTPGSPASLACSTETCSTLEEPDMEFEFELEHPSLMSSIPFRPKDKGHRELCDSGFLSSHSQSSDRRRRTYTPSLSGISDYSSVGSFPFKERSLTPVGRPPIDSPRNLAGELDWDDAGSDATVPAQDATGRILHHTLDILNLHIDDLSHAPASYRNLVNNFISDITWAVDEGIAKELDWDDATSNATVPAKDATGRILHYTLDVLDLRIDGLSHALRNLVNNFISDITWVVDEGIAEKRLPMQVNECAGSSGLNRLPTNASGSSSVTGGSQNSSQKNDQGKRKCLNGGDDDQDGDDEFDDGASKGGDPGPSKRQRVELALRIGCPFRKKNPLRFNVRDHRTCALTVFAEMSELRRHIQAYHKRPLPSPYQCLRCRRQFGAEGELRDHQLYLTGLCPVLEASLGSHNPEDGIDKPIADRLRSKKDRVGDSSCLQWEKIWGLLFPGTPVEPYQFQAVMEHFELYQRYRASLPLLYTSLRHTGLSERGLESLSNILDNHFIGLFEEVNEDGRQKEYHNRQPKPQHPQPSPESGSPRERLQAAHRDSGVDLDLDLEAISSEASLTKVDILGSAPPLDAQTSGVLGAEPLSSEPQPLDQSGLVGFDQPLDSSAFLNSYHGPMPVQLGTDVSFPRTYHGHTLQSMAGLPRSGGGLPEHDFGYENFGNAPGHEHWDPEGNATGHEPWDV